MKRGGSCFRGEMKKVANLEFEIGSFKSTRSLAYSRVRISERPMWRPGKYCISRFVNVERKDAKAKCEGFDALVLIK